MIKECLEVEKSLTITLRINTSVYIRETCNKDFLCRFIVNCTDSFAHMYQNMQLAQMNDKF